jgi:hypothetical protein
MTVFKFWKYKKLYLKLIRKSILCVLINKQISKTTIWQSCVFPVIRCFEELFRFTTYEGEYYGISFRN